MTNLENLKKLAEGLGADASKASTNLEALNAIAVALGGAGDARTNSEAIDNIEDVAAAAMEQNVVWADGITEFAFTDSSTGYNKVKDMIKSIVIPEGSSATGTGTETFAGSQTLEKVVFPSNFSVSSGCFGGCSALVEIASHRYEDAKWDGKSHVWNGAFGGTPLKNAKVSFGTTELNGTFGGCSALEMVEIPSTVATISSGCFGGCTNLTINIHKPENSISGAPWGATNATVNWLG